MNTNYENKMNHVAKFNNQSFRQTILDKYNEVKEIYIELLNRKGIDENKYNLEQLKWLCQIYKIILTGNDRPKYLLAKNKYLDCLTEQLNILLFNNNGSYNLTICGYNQSDSFTGDTEQARQVASVLKERKEHLENIEKYLWNL